MSVNLLISRPVIFSLQTLKNIPKCCYATASKGIVDGLEVEEVPAYEIDQKYDEEEIQRIRNKSRLWPQHRRLLNDEKPYDQSYEWYHDTIWYRKKMLGKYGIEAAGVTAGICWPTKDDIADKREYESLEYPHTIQEVWKQIEEKKKADALEIKKREEEIDKVVANFDKWRAALNAKVEKKEAELLASKQKKERLMMEIREQIGFNVDPRDERFQAMLAQKEKEDKKKKKEEKKKKRSEKMLTYLTHQHGTENVENQSDNKSEKAPQTNASEIESHINESNNNDKDDTKTIK